MTIKDFPSQLRELADRIEAAGLPEELSAEIEVSLGLYEHGIKDRPTLSRVVSLIGSGVEVETGCNDRNYLRKWRGRHAIRWTAWFTAGLLGGAVKTVVSDSTDGLDSLLAEHAESVGAK